MRVLAACDGFGGSQPWWWSSWHCGGAAGTGGTWGCAGSPLGSSAPPQLLPLLVLAQPPHTHYPQVVLLGRQPGKATGRAGRQVARPGSIPLQQGWGSACSCRVLQGEVMLETRGRSMEKGWRAPGTARVTPSALLPAPRAGCFCARYSPEMRSSSRFHHCAA